MESRFFGRRFSPVSTLHMIKEYKGMCSYHEKTPDRKNYIQGLGVYIGDPFAKGNSKLAKNILIFDLLAVDTCLNCADCAGFCYARKAQRQYAPTYNKRLFHTYLAFNDLACLERITSDSLKKSSRPFVRIHSAGDFVSQAYVNMWKRIADKFPEKRFYFYTKVSEIFDFSEFVALPNVNMVESVLPDGSINFGDESYIQEKSKIFGYHICPYGREGYASVHCGDECTLCMEKPHILFKLH